MDTISSILLFLLSIGGPYALVLPLHGKMIRNDIARRGGKLLHKRPDWSASGAGILYHVHFEDSYGRKRSATCYVELFRHVLWIDTDFLQPARNVRTEDADRRLREDFEQVRRQNRARRDP